MKNQNIKNIMLLVLSVFVATAIYLGVQIIGAVVAVLYDLFLLKGDINEIAVYRFLLQQDVLMSITAAMHICLLLVFGIWYKFGFARNVRLPIRQIFTVRNCICFIVIGVSLQFCISYIMQMITPLIPHIMENYEKLLDTLNLGTNLLSVVVTVLIAPFGEEFVFRGVIFGYAKRLMPFWIANIVQALAFGIYHGNLVQGTYAFCLGMIFGYLVQKCNSITASMAVHFCVNGFANIITLLAGSEQDMETGYVSVFLCLFVSIFTGLLCFVACRGVRRKSD